MSTELKPIKGDISTIRLTQFSGGRDRGICLELVASGLGEIPLTRNDANELAKRLKSWVDEVDRHRVDGV